MSMFRHSSRAQRGKKDKAIAPKCRHLGNSARAKSQVRSCKFRLSCKTRLPQSQPQTLIERPGQPQPPKRPSPRSARAGIVVTGASGVLVCKSLPGNACASSAPQLHPLTLAQWKRKVARAEAAANFCKRASAKMREEGVDRVLEDAREELAAIGGRVRDLAPQAIIGKRPEDGSEEAELLDARRMITALVRVSSGFRARRLEEEARQVVAEVNAHARAARAERLRRERAALDSAKRKELPDNSPDPKRASTSSPEAQPGAMPPRLAAGGC